MVYEILLMILGFFNVTQLITLNYFNLFYLIKILQLDSINEPALTLENINEQYHIGQLPLAEVN